MKEARLGTPNNPRRVGAYLRQSYKDSTRTWRVDGPPRKTRCFQREHWAGELDARVAPRPIKARLRVDNEED